MLDAKIVAAGSVALTVTLIAIFSLRPMAPRLGLIDCPDERKRHRGRVPLIGGLSFFFGTFAGLCYLGNFDSFVACLLAMGAVILLVGVLDDMYDLSVGLRLAAQAGAAGLVIVGSGVQIDSVGQFGESELRLHALGIPLTVIAVVGLMNAFNMIDGIDGLAGGLAVLCILAILAYSFGTGWQALGVLLFLQILLVAIVPFVFVNLGWPDGRKIFMGDAGSTVVGFLLAWSLIYLSQREVARLSPADVLWCIALPVMDTLAVMTRRISQGRSPFKADRQHLHHLVLDAGYSPRAALAFILSAAGLLAAAGYALRDVPDSINYAVFAVVLGLYVTQLPRALRVLGGLFIRPMPVDERTMTATFDRILAFDREQLAGTRQALVSGSQRLKALCVLGDSPDAVNVALVARQLLSDPRFDTKICVTDLGLDDRRRIMELFDIRADIQLDIGFAGSDATDVASATLNGMKRVLGGLKPDVVLVHGDTAATLGATLAACYQQIPVARLESASKSLESHARASGKINRRLASALASLHFTPTESAGQELVAAGIPRERITVTGDPVIETLRTAVERIREDSGLRHELAERFAFLRRGSPLLVVTHREQIADFAQLGRALRKVARRRPDVDIVYPLAMTAEEQKNTQLLGWRPANVHLVEPLDFPAFAYLLQSAYLVLTGSAEVEAEAGALGKPVLVLRDVLPDDGQSRDEVHSIPVDESAIAQGVMTLLDDPQVYETMRLACHGNAGDDASFRIVDALAAVPVRSSALAA